MGDNHRTALIKKSENRQKKIALVYKYTKNKKLAQSYRDTSYKKIQKEIIDFYTPILTIKRAKRADKRTIKYQKARNAGYTPKEATRMQDWSVKHINQVVRDNLIVNVASRRKRWKYMSIKRKMDYGLEIMARKFNLRKHKEMRRKGLRGLTKTDKKGKEVYDKNHGFGWGIVYTAYTRGLDPESLYKATKIDPFIPEIYKLPNSL